MPVALTIAGSDSGGGAGIQADLKMFAALGVHGTSVVTAVTAQNPRRVLDMQAVRPALVRRQLEAVFAELPPAAVKTGMLCSGATVRIVADFFRHRSRPVLIVDPVLISTSGTALLAPAALRVLREKLLPLAALVTPNLAEAAVLSGRTVRSPEDLRAAAREIHRRHGCAVLVKGGHLRGATEAADLFYNGTTELLLAAPFVRGVRTHGTGCTYSAAIAGWCARGEALARAVALAKADITRAIAQSVRVAGHDVLCFGLRRTR